MTGAHISMTSSSGDNRRWAVAGAAALIAHGAAVAAITALAVPAEDMAEAQPVMIVELPPEGVESSAASIPAAAQQQPQQTRSATRPSRPPSADPAPLAPPIPTPAARLPAQPMTPVRPLVRVAARPALDAVAAPALTAAVPAAAPVPAPAAPRGAPDSPGDNPRARAAEADYFSLLSAHLNRRKTYPAEAKQALQQGIVTVRFTVARDGSVSGASIRKGSGHALLDRATLDLVQRVAPLPRFPRGMARDSVTISLPIEYSLRTD